MFQSTQFSSIGANEKVFVPVGDLATELNKKN
jgi:hypothetical protein